MRKVILVNGDIATGKSHFAVILKERFNLPCFTKDEYKEEFAQTFPFSTYEESHKLSIMAMDTLVRKFSESAEQGIDVILEANFHEDYLKQIDGVCKRYNYSILNINLIGNPKVLYPRYINRMNNESRHPVHAVNKINDYSVFEKYTLDRRQEALIGEVIDVDANSFAYQKDERLLGKIEDFLKS